MKHDKDDVLLKVNRFLNNCYLFENMNTSRLYLYNTTKKCFYMLCNGGVQFLGIYRLQNDGRVKMVARISFYNDIEYNTCLPDNVRLYLEKNKCKKHKIYKQHQLECIFYNNLII